MATVQYYDGSAWVDLDNAQWSVKQAVSSVKVAPTAEIATTENVIAANTQVRVQDTDTGTTVFEGYARSRGQVEASGRRTITVDGYGGAGVVFVPKRRHRRTVLADRARQQPARE